MSCRCSSIRSFDPRDSFLLFVEWNLFSSVVRRGFLPLRPLLGIFACSDDSAPSPPLSEYPAGPTSKLDIEAAAAPPPSRIRLPPDHQWPQPFSCASPGKADAEISRSLVPSISTGPLSKSPRESATPRERRGERALPPTDEVFVVPDVERLFLGGVLSFNADTAPPVHSLEPSVSPKQRTSNGRLPNSTVTVRRLHFCADRPPGQLPFSKNHPPKPLCGCSPTPWAQWRAKASSSCHGRCGSR